MSTPCGNRAAPERVSNQVVGALLEARLDQRRIALDAAQYQSRFEKRSNQPAMVSIAMCFGRKGLKYGPVPQFLPQI